MAHFRLPLVDARGAMLCVVAATALLTSLFANAAAAQTERQLCDAARRQGSAVFVRQHCIPPPSSGARRRAAATTPSPVSAPIFLNYALRAKLVSAAPAGDRILDVTFSPDGASIAAGWDNLGVRIWNLRDQTEAQAQPAHPGFSTTAVMFTPDNNAIISEDQYGTVALSDARTGQLINPKLATLGSPLYVSPEGSYVLGVAYSSSDRSVLVLDAATGQQIGPPIQNDVCWVSDIVVNSGRIIAVLRDGTVRVWDLQTRQEIGAPLKVGSLPCPSGWGQYFQLSADGRRILRTLPGADDSQARSVWDATTGQMTSVLRGAQWTGPAALSPDGRLAAVLMPNGMIGLWDATTGEQVGSAFDPSFPPGNTDPINTMAFSPDGRSIAAGMRDQTIRIWDLRAP